MKNPFFLLISALVAASAIGAPTFHAEGGASYFVIRDARLEPAPDPLAVDEPRKVAPFVGVTYDMTDQIAFRFSYHYLSDVRTTVVFGSPPGSPPSPLPIIIWGHYEDDVHLVTVAPEFKWRIGPTVTFSIAPQVNWVASRGVVSYSTTNPLVLLLAPRERDDEGLTLGGSARIRWALGSRAAISLGYQYVDLDPSFGRKAHAFTGGLQWSF
jgi:hypothetical protein